MGKWKSKGGRKVKESVNIKKKKKWMLKKIIGKLKRKKNNNVDADMT